MSLSRIVRGGIVFQIQNLIEVTCLYWKKFIRANNDKLMMCLKTSKEFGDFEETVGITNDEENITCALNIIISCNYSNNKSNYLESS